MNISRRFLLQPDNINEKSIYVAIQNNKYYMRHTSTLQDLDLRKYYPFFITKNLVLEGANFLLMRYLAITRHVGTIELATMYINGEMCRNIYVGREIFRRRRGFQCIFCRSVWDQHRAMLMANSSRCARFTDTSSKSAA